MSKKIQRLSTVNYSFQRYFVNFPRKNICFRKGRKIKDFPLQITHMKYQLTLNNILDCLWGTCHDLNGENL